MSRVRWHIVTEGDTLTLSRRLPARFDVAAETRLPDAGRAKVAHQVRQDMWRALQDLRGFAPVVQVRRDGDHLVVVAGGEIAGPVARDHVQHIIQEVLETPAKRARWVRHAKAAGPRS